MHATSEQRHIEMLKTALTPELMVFLLDDDVIEVMANPDGKIWLDTLSNGKYLALVELSFMQRLNIIKLIASFNHLMINEDHPELACELAFLSARFQAWVSPVSSSPTFTIRKKARRILSLDYYVENGWLSADQSDFLKSAIKKRLNILVAGGTGSGKTTFANALLNELSDTSDRIVVLEDLAELQVSAPDVVTLRTTSVVSMRDLVKGSLRMRPDRIVIGEVRDGAALDLLKAWNTGHPGGVCTLHANRADSVIPRLEDLIMEASAEIPKRLISEAIDVIVFMHKEGSRDYLIKEIITVNSY